MTTKKAPPVASPAPKNESCNPLELELDPYNPRLTSAEEGASQSDLLRLMIEKFKISEIADSIIATGFIPFDPIIGWRHNGTVTVLEGNRRIAAIKLLLDPEQAPEKHRAEWRQLSKQLSSQTRSQIQRVEVDQR